MIIVFGTPRSGTTFFTRWILNENPDHEYLAEYFQPWFFEGDNHYDIVTERLNNLKDNSLFKVHTGDELDSRVLELVKNNPVHVVIRKNKLEQIISMGLASITDTWVTYDDKNTYCKGVYKREWFDDITNRIDQFETICPTLNIAQIYYYEDINKYRNNGTLPIKQNKYSLQESLDLFLNKDELQEWYDDWIRK